MYGVRSVFRTARWWEMSPKMSNCFDYLKEAIIDRFKIGLIRIAEAKENSSTKHGLQFR